MGAMESLRRYYRVPAKRGRRVWWHWNGRDVIGPILSAKDHKLYVRDERTGRREGPFHPTWQLVYL